MADMGAVAKITPQETTVLGDHVLSVIAFTFRPGPGDEQTPHRARRSRSGARMPMELADVSGRLEHGCRDSGCNSVPDPETLTRVIRRI